MKWLRASLLEPERLHSERDSTIQFSSVQSLSRVSLRRLHGLPPARLLCPSQLPERTQTHVHWVPDAIQPSHSLSSPSPPTFSLSQHQGLFQWVSSLHQVAKVLELYKDYKEYWDFLVFFSFRSSTFIRSEDNEQNCQWDRAKSNNTCLC